MTHLVEDRETLAQQIHEGGWQIAANGRNEWRWCKATSRERTVAYAKADALLASRRVVAATSLAENPGIQAALRDARAAYDRARSSRLFYDRRDQPGFDEAEWNRLYPDPGNLEEYLLRAVAAALTDQLRD